MSGAGTFQRILQSPVQPDSLKYISELVKTYVWNTNGKKDLIHSEVQETKQKMSS